MPKKEMEYLMPKKEVRRIDHKVLSIILFLRPPKSHLRLRLSSQAHARTWATVGEFEFVGQLSVNLRMFSILI